MVPAAAVGLARAIAANFNQYFFWGCRPDGTPDGDPTQQFRYASGFVSGGHLYNTAVCMSDPDADGLSTGTEVGRTAYLIFVRISQ